MLPLWTISDPVGSARFYVPGANNGCRSFHHALAHRRRDVDRVNQILPELRLANRRTPFLPVLHRVPWQKLVMELVHDMSARRLTLWRHFREPIVPWQVPLAPFLEVLAAFLDI